MDLNLRHGSLIMVAYVVLGLADTAVAKQRYFADSLGFTLDYFPLPLHAT